MFTDSNRNLSLVGPSENGLGGGSLTSRGAGAAAQMKENRGD